MAVNNPATWLFNNFKKIKAPKSHNSEVWKEAKQEAFLKLYKNLYNIELKECRQYVNSTIYSIYNRITYKTKREVSIDYLEYHKQPEDYTEFDIENNQLIIKMKELIDKLPIKQKEAVNNMLQNKHLTKVAGTANYNTTKANYRQGLLKLKQQMKGMKWE